MSIHEVEQRIPAALWEALKDVCYKKDLEFITTVARILHKDAGEMRRRVLGARGELNILLADGDPWWLGGTCTLMVRGKGGLWARCPRTNEMPGRCRDHRNYKHASCGLRQLEDPYFAGLVRRYPFRLLDETVWVCEKGTILGEDGILRTEYTIDLTTGFASSNPHTISSPPEKPPPPQV